MKYAGWNRKEKGDEHFIWNHRDSDSTVQLYRYGETSNIEIRLGTRRIGFERKEFEFSNHETAKKLVYAILDSIQAGFQTSTRLEEEGFGQFSFNISTSSNERTTKVLEMKFIEEQRSYTESFYDYMNNLLNFYGTNHYFEAGSRYPDRGAVFVSVYKEEPFSMSKKELREQRRRIKQEIR